MKIFKFLLDIVSPKKCYSCKKEWCFICKECFSSFYEFEEKCYVCKKFSKNFEVHEFCKSEKNIFYDKILVLKHYKNQKIQKLIKDGKFYGKTEILEEFSYFMYEKFLENEKIDDLKDYLIISIPSYFLRRWKRWYNSSEILAKHFANFSKINYEKNILKKIKHTKQQSKLNRKERLKNLKNSFTINKFFFKKIKNKKILIIDDVISTWSTLNEISSILKQNSVEKIIWITIASD